MWCEGDNFIERTENAKAKIRPDRNNRYLRIQKYIGNTKTYLSICIYIYNCLLVHEIRGKCIRQTIGQSIGHCALSLVGVYGFKWCWKWRGIVNAAVNRQYDLASNAIRSLKLPHMYINIYKVLNKCSCRSAKTRKKQQKRIAG